MFTGTVESKSHEGGLLVHFDGSSPALNAIMVRADDGTYIGKVDGVIGSTDRPLAHVLMLTDPSTWTPSSVCP